MELLRGGFFPSPTPCTPPHPTLVCVVVPADHRIIFVAITTSHASSIAVSALAAHAALLYSGCLHRLFETRFRSLSPSQKKLSQKIYFYCWFYHQLIFFYEQNLCMYVTIDI
jgi:hypothetical protein